LKRKGGKLHGPAPLSFTATPRSAAIKELLPELLGPTIAMISPALKVSYRRTKRWWKEGEVDE